MRVIDLLNKIANGEAPKRIKYNTFELKRTMSNNLLKTYVDEEGMFFPEYYSGLTLNDEVEIIEKDKKIKKLSDFYEEQINENGSMSEPFNKHELKIINKINEIIDEVNKLKEGE